MSKRPGTISVDHNIDIADIIDDVIRYGNEKELTELVQGCVDNLGAEIILPMLDDDAVLAHCKELFPEEFNGH
jgi:hypothetical protein